MRTTIRDVARLACVSVATVSAVMNQKHGVSDRLEGKVQHAIKALDYYPDHVARSLRVKHTRTIGIIMPQFASLFFAEVLRGVEDAADHERYSVLICNSGDDAVREKHELETLVSRRVDGILLASVDPHFAYHWLSARHVQLVLFDRVPAGYKGTAVTTANASAAFEATKHLIDLGHRQIAIITGPPDVSTAAERVEGFRKAMGEAGVCIREDYFKCGGFCLDGGYRCGLELMRLGSPPTSVFSCNYEMTLGLMRALAELSLRCPSQVSVLGFDDFVVGADGFSLATMLSPKLTTVAQHSYELGRKAMQLLLEKMARPDKDQEDHEGVIRLPADLRIRESTSPPLDPCRI